MSVQKNYTKIQSFQRNNNDTLTVLIMEDPGSSQLDAPTVLISAEERTRLYQTFPEKAFSDKQLSSAALLKNALAKSMYHSYEMRMKLEYQQKQNPLKTEYYQRKINKLIADEAFLKAIFPLLAEFSKLEALINKPGNTIENLEEVLNQYKAGVNHLLERLNDFELIGTTIRKENYKKRIETLRGELTEGIETFEENIKLFKARPDKYPLRELFDNQDERSEVTGLGKFVARQVRSIALAGKDCLYEIKGERFTKQLISMDPAIKAFSNLGEALRRKNHSLAGASYNNNVESIPQGMLETLAITSTDNNPEENDAAVKRWQTLGSFFSRNEQSDPLAWDKLFCFLTNKNYYENRKEPGFLSDCVLVIGGLTAASIELTLSIARLFIFELPSALITLSCTFLVNLCPSIILGAGNRTEGKERKKRWQDAIDRAQNYFSNTLDSWHNSFSKNAGSVYIKQKWYETRQRIDAGGTQTLLDKAKMNMRSFYARFIDHYVSGKAIKENCERAASSVLITFDNIIKDIRYIGFQYFRFKPISDDRKKVVEEMRKLIEQNHGKIAVENNADEVKQNEQETFSENISTEEQSYLREQPFYQTTDPIKISTSESIMDFPDEIFMGLSGLISQSFRTMPGASTAAFALSMTTFVSLLPPLAGFFANSWIQKIPLMLTKKLVGQLGTDDMGRVIIATLLEWKLTVLGIKTGTSLYERKFFEFITELYKNPEELISGMLTFIALGHILQFIPPLPSTIEIPAGKINLVSNNYYTMALNAFSAEAKLFASGQSPFTALEYGLLGLKFVLFIQTLISGTHKPSAKNLQSSPGEVKEEPLSEETLYEEVLAEGMDIKALAAALSGPVLTEFQSAHNDILKRFSQAIQNGTLGFDTVKYQLDECIGLFNANNPLPEELQEVHKKLTEIIWLTKELDKQKQSFKSLKNARLFFDELSAHFSEYNKAVKAYNKKHPDSGYCPIDETTTQRFLDAFYNKHCYRGSNNALRIISLWPLPPFIVLTYLYRGIKWLFGSPVVKHQVTKSFKKDTVISFKPWPWASELLHNLGRAASYLLRTTAALAAAVPVGIAIVSIKAWREIRRPSIEDSESSAKRTWKYIAEECIDKTDKLISRIRLHDISFYAIGQKLLSYLTFGFLNINFCQMHARACRSAGTGGSITEESEHVLFALRNNVHSPKSALKSISLPEETEPEETKTPDTSLSLSPAHRDLTSHSETDSTLSGDEDSPWPKTRAQSLPFSNNNSHLFSRRTVTETSVQADHSLQQNTLKRSASF